MSYIDYKKLFSQEFLSRENSSRHHKYDEEMRLYDLMKSGDLRAVEESLKMFRSDLPGHLSNDSLRNFKYLFIASITLATRFAIEGGMDEELAYNSSDLYIQKVDSCKTTEEIFDLYGDMFKYFTMHMAALKKQSAMSKAVVLCLDYINYHLHEKITVNTLADYVNLNPTYLCSLFKKETGKKISEFIMHKRMEEARHLLRFSDLTCIEIACTLSFSSQSHFTKAFRDLFGITPNEYRKEYFRAGYLHKEKNPDEF